MLLIRPLGHLGQELAPIASEPTATWTSAARQLIKATSLPTTMVTEDVATETVQVFKPNYSCSEASCVGNDAATQTLFIQMQLLINMIGQHQGWAGQSWWTPTTTDGRIDARAVADYQVISNAIGGALSVPPDARLDTVFLAEASPSIVPRMAAYLGVAIPEVSAPSPGAWLPGWEVPPEEEQPEEEQLTPEEGLPPEEPPEEEQPPSAGTQAKEVDFVPPPPTFVPPKISAWQSWKQAIRQLTPIQKGAIAIGLGIALLGAVAVSSRRRQPA